MLVCVLGGGVALLLLFYREYRKRKRGMGEYGEKEGEGREKEG
jgi:hypothetical protein